MPDPLFDSLTGTTGHGAIGLAGRMGYPTNAGDRVIHPAFAQGWELISAHADSHLHISLRHRAEVVAFLNPTAKLAPANPVEFWADFNHVGACTGPGETTRKLKLDPGPHRLDAWALGPDTDWRHSVWALRPDPDSQPIAQQKNKHSSAHPTPESLAIITAACYPARTAIDVLRPLAMSAAKQNFRLHVIGVDEPHESHVTTKVHRLRRWLPTLPDHITHVLWIDARDTLFQSAPADICCAYNDLGSPIVTGAERGAHPVYDPAWDARIAAGGMGGRDSLNAGCWMGERAVIADALDFLSALFCYFNGTLPLKALLPLAPALDVAALEFCKRFCRVPRPDPLHHNDQFLWQSAHLCKALPIKLDDRCRLVATLSTHPELSFDNPQYAVRDAKLTARESRHAPPILHFAGQCPEYSILPWAGYLGLV